MGVYDLVGPNGMQIKSGPRNFNHYDIGDDVSNVYPNGIHVCYEGAFAVQDGKIVAITEVVWDKWGNELDPKDIIRHTSILNLKDL